MTNCKLFRNVYLYMKSSEYFYREMLGPEGTLVNESFKKEEQPVCPVSLVNKIPGEGNGSVELNKYKTAKTWKKTISTFFRNQLRSTKSNDGDRPSGSKDIFEEKEISPQQKWQSLGKAMRRHGLGDHWSKPSNQHGESSSQNKRLAVKRVLSGYIGKIQKVLNVDEK